MRDINDPIFTDENAAREHLESVQWPDGPVCPRCGTMDRLAKMEGASYRPGLYHCASCRRQFTVTVGTVYERSKIPLHKWLLATYLLCSSKKGMSAHQLHRMLGITYKSAWFMEHRIREGMRDSKPEGMGGSGKVVEADETYFGDKDVVTKRSKRGKSGLSGKRAVLGLVERGGKARMIHMHEVSAVNVSNMVRRNLSRESALMTDESRLYSVVGGEFVRHGRVTHSEGEYVRDDVHTNTIEGYFSIFKRGMRGIYQHCGEAHLHRCLSEFDFRYNTRTKLGFTDAMRTLIALEGIRGKRLTYRRAD